MDIIKKNINCIIGILLFLNVVSISFASVEWDIQKEFTIKANVRDIAASKNGKWIYVLSDNGKILIYSNTGQLKDEINIKSNIGSIEAGPQEGMLFLYNAEKSTVQTITFDFIQKIDISESSFLGNPNAPVVIVVFTDYQ